MLNGKLLKGLLTAAFVNQIQMENVSVAVSAMGLATYNGDANKRLQVLKLVYRAQAAFATICKAIM
jgi:hypothetical protein